MAAALDVKSTHSLANFLKGNVTPRDLLCPTVVGDLGGNSEENEIHLLSKDTMLSLIQTTRKLFDYVILDTPPVPCWWMLRKLPGLRIAA